MVVARNTSETFPYVIEAERGAPVEEQTVFHLRCLPASVGLALDNLQSGTVDLKISVRLGDQMVVTLRAGLAGWDNFKDAEGKAIEFKRDQGERAVFGVTIKNPAAAAMIDYLPEKVAQELAVAIRHGNTVTRADVGN